MKKFWMFTLCTVCFTLLAVASDHRPLAFKAVLKGINETPPIATEATGFFVATPNSDGTFNFILTFNGLSSNAVVSHIHFGLSKEMGGVMIFLCGGGGQPACPAVTSGTVTGTFGAANVVGPTAQGVVAGDLATALQQIGQGAGYVNLHSTNFPSGEIRGQVFFGKARDDN